MIITGILTAYVSNSLGREEASQRIDVAIGIIPLELSILQS